MDTLAEWSKVRLECLGFDISYLRMHNLFFYFYFFIFFFVTQHGYFVTYPACIM